MFTADLAWNEEGSELVGERKARKTRQRESSISSSNSSIAAALRSPTPKDSAVSIPFASVFSAASSFGKSAKKKRSETPIDPKTEYRDPAKQPAEWTISAILSPTLPSGESMDIRAANTWGQACPTPYRQPKPLGHRAWAIADKAEADALVKSYEKVKETIMTIQADHQGGFLHRRNDLKSEFSDTTVDEVQELPLSGYEVDPLTPPKSPLYQTEKDDLVDADFCVSPRSMDERQAILQTVTVSVSEESLYDYHELPASPTPPPPPPKSPIHSPLWQAPPAWNRMPQKEAKSEEQSCSSRSQSPDPCEADRIIASSTHFQRFIRLLEGAGPKIILSRLTEEWGECVDEAAMEELFVEKHLSALTALQLPALDRFAKLSLSEGPDAQLPPNSLKGRRKILEIDGNIGELYQLAATYPDSKIIHLTRQYQAVNTPLPLQATRYPLRELATSGHANAATYPYLPLPFASGSMHHVRCSRLASLLPAAEIPALIAECHRVLKPGGVLELRLMDAMPDRASTGPQMAAWLEERLLLNLEADFRCSRPLALVPQWVKAAGFKPLPLPGDDSINSRTEFSQRKKTSLGKLGIKRCLRLPAIADDGADSLDRMGETGRELAVSQVGVLVARALWTDVWGNFVGEDSEEEFGATAWWDDAELANECREWKTAWDVATLVVTKEA